MNSKDENNEDFFDIDLHRLINAVFTRIKIIVSFAIAFGISAFLLSNFVITPKYAATITMCVNNNKTMASDTLDFNDVNAGIALVPTISKLIQSYNIVDEVAAKTQDLGYVSDDILAMMGISSIDETQILALNIVNPNPEHANIIANAFADVIPGKINDLMEGSSVKIVDESVIPEKPVSPNAIKYSVYGFIFGGFIGVLLAILLELLDTTIKNEDELINLYPNLPVLGVIPDFGVYEEKFNSENSK